MQFTTVGIIEKGFLLQTWYLTPASISYLNQFLLALLITIYLGLRYFAPGSQPRRRQDSLLVAFFICVTIFSLLLFLEASYLPSERIIVVYLENTVLGLLLVTLIQFAYHFPVPNEKQKVERIIALVLSSAYVLWEAEFAIQRFILLQDGQVIFREFNMDKAIVVEFGWIVFVFMRNSIRNWKLPATRQLALIFFIPLWLAILNYYRGVYQISTPLYHINVSIGILFTIFFFALTYLTSQPERTSFITKLSGTVLTSVLAVFGVVAWLVTPAYARQYTPSIPDHRTIHFVPNERGGYDVSEIPFHFEQDLGQRLEQIDVNSVKGIDFDFLFFGQPYNKIFISSDGAIGVGTEFVWRDFQYHFVNIPMIFPLLVDLDSYNPQNGGIFLRQEASQAIITYYKMPSQNHPEAKYTFQVSLFPDGSFDFTYNGLPELTFYVDDRPEATAWAIGVKPALAPQGSVDFSSLPLQGGPEGLLQDEYRSFRIYLHEFLLPLALAVLISSLLFLIGLPLILNFSLAHPLTSLLKGVQTFNDGQRDGSIPVKFNDEIGYLTQSFNTMAGELNTLITNLESRVAARTAQLTETNLALQNSQKFFEELFEASPDAVLAINPQGSIKQVNTQVETMFGYSRAELIGQPIEVVMPARFAASHPPKRAEYLAKPSARAMGDATALFGCRKDGSEFPVDIRLSPVEFTEGQLTLVVVRDISVRVEMEQSLKQAQAELLNQQLSEAGLEERQRLARNLHDTLSQSIHSLVLFSETLTAAIEKNNLERAKQIVERVQESARQSHKETRLLLYELQAPGRGRSVNLMRDLQERLTKVENRSGIPSEIILDGSPDHIPAGWHENLYWIAMEALNNALKHAQARKMQILIHSSPQQLELEVVDDGRGFVPGHTLAGGMGLENMSERAQLLGGELTVESEPMKGTRVRFRAEIKAG